MEKPEKSSSPSEFGWLDEFLDSVEAALGFMDLSTLQPTSWGHVHPLMAEAWLDWFSRILEEREKQGVSFERLAQVLPPGLMHAHLIFSMEDAKVARWPLEKRLKIAGFFYDLIRAGARGDYFSLHGTNPVHSPEQVKEIISREFLQGTPEVAKAQGRLYNSAYNLGAALYLDFYMDKTICTDGPYDLGNGRILVVKEANFMRPLELWPDLSTEAENVKIYAVYHDVEFRLDLITCHTQFQGDAINGLKQLRIEKDGQAMKTIAEIDSLAKNLAENSKQQWKRVMSLPQQQLLEKAVWIRCYIFKPARELLGLDWKPTPELLEAVKGKTLEQGWSTWKQPTEEKEYKQYWRRILDPREEFYP